MVEPLSSTYLVLGSICSPTKKSKTNFINTTVNFHIKPENQLIFLLLIKESHRLSVLYKKEIHFHSQLRRRRVARLHLMLTFVGRFWEKHRVSHGKRMEHKLIFFSLSFFFLLLFTVLRIEPKISNMLTLHSTKQLLYISTYISFYKATSIQLRPSILISFSNDFLTP